MTLRDHHLNLRVVVIAMVIAIGLAAYFAFGAPMP